MRRITKKENIENDYLSAVRKDLHGFTPVHCHEFYEIEYIVSGEGTYTVDGTAYPISPGSLFFMTPINTHSVDARYATVYNLMFSGDMGNPAILAKLAFQSPVILRADPSADRFFTALMDELASHCGDREYAGILLDPLLSKLTRSAEAGPQRKTLSPINQAELYILNHLKADLTLAAVAARFGFSPSYFSRLFAAETGKSFKAYVSELRLDFAKKLLIQTSMTVSHICEECGFRDYPNFIRRFTQYAGMTPSAYRQQHS